MTIEHRVFKTGMLADDVLMIEKKTGRRRVAKNTIEGEDKEKGLIVRWYLVDCTLVLGRDKNPGPYVIQDILEPIEAEGRLISAKQAGLTDDSLENLTTL